MNVWRPIKGTHAIQVASAHVSFKQPATDLMWQRIKDAAEKAAKAGGMPHREPVQSFTVALVPNALPQAPSLPVEVGVEFQKRDPSGDITSKMTVLRDSVRLEEWAYTRWAGMRAKCAATLVPVLNDYLSNLLLSGITLEYADVFQTPIGNVAEDVGRIIDKGSQLISQGAFQSATPWHSHCGWFETPAPAIRRLVQMNVDVGEAVSPMGPFKAAQLRTLLNDQFNQDGMPPFDSPPNNFVLDTLDALHVLSKSTLAKVLTIDAKTTISL